jgi:hypothetical protein
LISHEHTRAHTHTLYSSECCDIFVRFTHVAMCCSPYAQRKKMTRKRQSYHQAGKRSSTPRASVSGYASIAF